MFTGLIEDVGTIEQVRTTPAGRELRVRSAFDDLAAGDSVACDGAGLTVLEVGSGYFTVAAITTTVDRTTVGDWTVGRRVNLERALRLGARLGGHMVLGHVDGVGVVSHVEAQGDARIVNVTIPESLAELMIPHGSLAVDGVSLTVNELPAPDTVQLSLIDYTLSHTTLGELRPGRRVHIEGDVIGKYARRMLAPYQAPFQVSSVLHDQD